MNFLSHESVSDTDAKIFHRVSPRRADNSFQVCHQVYPKCFDIGADNPNCDIAGAEATQAPQHNSAKGQGSPTVVRLPRAGTGPGQHPAQATGSPGRRQWSHHPSDAPCWTSLRGELPFPPWILASRQRHDTQHGVCEVFLLRQRNDTLLRQFAGAIGSNEYRIATGFAGMCSSYCYSSRAQCGHRNHGRCFVCPPVFLCCHSNSKVWFGLPTLLPAWHFWQNKFRSSQRLRSICP